MIPDFCSTVAMSNFNCQVHLLMIHICWKKSYLSFVNTLTHGVTLRIVGSYDPTSLERLLTLGYRTKMSTFSDFFFIEFSCSHGWLELKYYPCSTLYRPIPKTAASLNILWFMLKSALLYLPSQPIKIQIEVSMCSQMVTSEIIN